MTIKINEKILAELRAELNAQTAQYPWTELQRYFATGSVIIVAPELDLVDAAARVATDDKASVQQWMQAGQRGKVTDEQAAFWFTQNILLWTVVVKPWILVQHKNKPSVH